MYKDVSYPFLLTREQASDFLGIDPKSFDKYIRSHSDLKRFMIGKQERFTVDELVYFVKLYLLYGTRAVSDFVLFRKLVHSNSALYTVSIRQFGTLRRASFRLHPTVDTLPFANSSYCQACSGLSPPSYNPCRAHDKNAQNIFRAV
ncbi:helix-turn-helix domain-containing protein [Jeotgalicoccus huakuii]|nr:helix-turn-helix domain-containing protein [Jeotgalicoccus huakuii]